jgi:hypothetical protein
MESSPALMDLAFSKLCMTAAVDVMFRKEDGTVIMLDSVVIDMLQLLGR